MKHLRAPLVLLLALTAPQAVLARGGVAARPAAFPEHVVLVILGGGVRAQDMRDKELMPTLAAMAAAGHVVDQIVSGAEDGYAASARILTGDAAVLDGGRKPRPSAPTVFEYARAALDLPREKVWFVSFEGEDQLHLACSEHAQFGAVFAPGLAHGQGPFAQPLAGFLESLGRPVPMEPETWAHLRRLRLLSRSARAAYLPEAVDAGLPPAERVERALLRELDRKALLNQGPNPRDELATRAALTVLEVHRPVLTVVRYGEAEQGQASYEAYRKVLAADDAGLGRLRAAVAADARMAGRTLFFVVADRGRNAEPDAQGRLGADDASKARRLVSAILEGPGLAHRPVLKGPRALEDVAPTIGHLLGFTTPHASGSPWSGICNER